MTLDYISDATFVQFAVAILLIIYGVICLLVPICIYAVMKNTRLSKEALQRIEQLLEPPPVNKEVQVNKPVKALTEQKVDAKPKEPGWFKR